MVVNHWWQKEKPAREEAAEELEKSRKEIRKLQKEVAKLSREQETLNQQLEDKEKLPEKRTAELRSARDGSSAANLRARKAQVLGSRASAARSSVKSYPSVVNSAFGSQSTSGGSITVTSEEVLEIQ